MRSTTFGFRTFSLFISIGPSALLQSGVVIAGQEAYQSDLVSIERTNLISPRLSPVVSFSIPVASHLVHLSGLIRQELTTLIPRAVSAKRSDCCEEQESPLAARQTGVGAEITLVV